jgi:ABC-2 type transport system ATP-binding protein
MLLGLITADSGHIRIFDHEVPLAINQIIDRVGAVVEQPKFFPAFSGQKNLELIARAIGAPRRRVDKVLHAVGLSRRGTDKFRHYSLGMKQRLAIAATLLKDPDLLIFDEPTNGLDPAGIHEIRTMMRNLARHGKTVLVSSHILTEVQQIADTVTIIGRGRLLAEGNVSDILAANGQLSARVGVSDHLRASEVLTASGFAVEPLASRLLKVSLSDQRLDLAVITRLLADQGLYVSELTPIQPDLESVFLNLTGGDQPGTRQQRRQPEQRRRQGGQHQPERRRQPQSQRVQPVGASRSDERVMIRLLSAEATRLLSRRFTGIALLALLLGLGGYQLVVNDSLSPLTGEQLAVAEQAYQQSHKDWVDNHEKYEQDCRDTSGTAEDCTVPEPTLNDFSVEPTPFKEAARTSLELSTVLVSLVTFMIGASFIGAEYSSGSISNWLTFVPRRGPVFWSKLLTDDRVCSAAWRLGCRARGRRRHCAGPIP